jgi:hypothetical protein
LDDAIQKADQSLHQTIEKIHDGSQVPSIADGGLQSTWSVAIGEDVPTSSATR